MKETASLNISVLVPLMFFIGTILVLIFKRRTRCIKIIIYIIHITAFMLGIAYLLTSILDYGQFFRKLFVLYFPIILITFGYILSLHDTVPILLMISTELTIIHTEIETTKIPVIIVLCIFFITCHSLIYAYNVDFHNISLQLEKISEYYSFLFFIWVVIQIYCWVLYGTMAEIKLKALLFLFIPIFLVAPCLFMLHTPDMLKKIDQTIIRKFIISLHIIMCNVLSYIKNDKIVSITTPIFTAYLVFVSQIIYIYIYKKQDYCYEEDGDFYRINRENKTAELIGKGDKNDFIKEYLIIDGIKVKIIDFCDYIWGLGKSVSNIIIQNEKFAKKYEPYYWMGVEFTTVTFDCEIKYIGFRNYVDKTLISKNIIVTEKCKSFVTNSNKLFSRGMDLCFCRKNSNHILINESCRIIRATACIKCFNLRSIKFPDSLIKIGDSAFNGCQKLRNITFGKDSQLQFIGIEAFAKTDLRILYFPKSLCFIGSRAFGDCQKLRRVVFPEISFLKILDLSSFNDKNISIEIPMPVHVCQYPNSSKLRINSSQTNNFMKIVSFK